MTILFPRRFLIELYLDVVKGYFVLNQQENFSAAQWVTYRQKLLPRFRQLYALQKSMMPIKIIRINILALEILQFLITDFFVLDASRAQQVVDDLAIERMNKIVTYITKNHTSEIKLADIARGLQFSRGYTAKVIKSVLCKALNEYLALVRCKHACEWYAISDCGAT